MAIKKIGELLVESGLILPEQLEEVLEASRKEFKGERLGAVIVKKGLCTEMDIAQTLSFQLNIPFIDISTTEVSPEAVELIDEKLAKKFLIFPVSVERRVLKLAMADPLNLDAIDDIRFSSGIQVQPCSAALSDVTAAIKRYYHLNEPIEDLMVDFQKDKLVEVVHEQDSGRDLAEQVRKSSAPPIIKMVDSIIIHGVEKGASDIHLEPQESNVKLRIRVDGIMRETMQLPKWVQGPVVSRIKLMGKMDIAERRVSQDGRLKVRISDKSYDVRVSTLPTQYGETVVMRILDPKSSLLGLESTGLAPADLEKVRDMIRRPQGVVLVTGPTGSGKTSTLYAMLRHIKSEAINIITIEDPIEYELKGVNQVAVNEKTGLTFSYSLRSVLRQDPDVILVGEMRDTETAIIAHQASLTGHLVFSTLHTNDAISSVIRLKNMGVPPYMAASALNGIVAQRLVRAICEKCKVAYRPEPEDIKRSGVVVSSEKFLYRGTGCEECNETGYSGRIGIFEVLRMTRKLKALVASDASEAELMAAAREAGMTPLHVDGLGKVMEGRTTLEELARVVYLSDEEPHPENICPECFKSVEDGAGACPHCGTALARRCPTCARGAEAGWVACPFCAHVFSPKEGPRGGGPS